MYKALVALLLVIPLVTLTQDTLAKNAAESYEQKELRCLAENIYYEAGNQSLRGKVAVAYVTLNRLKSPSYPKSVCGVVHQQSSDQVCQFSWVCERLYRDDGKPSVKSKTIYNESYRIARIVYAFHGNMHDPTFGALFYHARYVWPEWSRRLVKTVQIGDHVFYIPKGKNERNNPK